MAEWKKSNFCHIGVFPEKYPYKYLASGRLLKILIGVGRGSKVGGGVRRGESPNQINTIHANIVCCACLNILRLVTMWVEIVVGL